MRTGIERIQLFDEVFRGVLLPHWFQRRKNMAIADQCDLTRKLSPYV
jgi:hypothetical protein